MTVIEIVKKYLKENGYDGLYNRNAECACATNEVCPWGEIGGQCEPAYKIFKDQMTEDERYFAEYEGSDFVYRPAEEE
jgi:hypothetical protein